MWETSEKKGNARCEKKKRVGGKSEGSREAHFRSTSGWYTQEWRNVFSRQPRVARGAWLLRPHKPRCDGVESYRAHFAASYFQWKYFNTMGQVCAANAPCHDGSRFLSSTQTRRADQNEPYLRIVKKNNYSFLPLLSHLSILANSSCWMTSSCSAMDVCPLRISPRSMSSFFASFTCRKTKNSV